MVSCNAASKATMPCMGSMELLLRARVFAILDLNEMGGTTLPREVLGASLSGLVSCGWWWGSASSCGGCCLRTLPHTQNHPPSTPEGKPLIIGMVLLILGIDLVCFLWSHLNGVRARSESVSSIVVYGKNPSRTNSGFCCHRYLKILRTMFVSMSVYIESKFKQRTNLKLT